MKVNPKSRGNMMILFLSLFYSFSSYAQYIDIENLDSFSDSLDYFRAKARVSSDTLFLAQFHFSEGVLAELYYTKDSVSITHFRRSGELYESIGDYDMEARCRYNIGDVYRKNGMYTESLSIFKNVLDYYKSSGNNQMMAHIYSSMANLYHISDENEKEVWALERADSLVQDSFLMGIVKYQFARKHLVNGDYDKALEIAQMALPIIKSTNWRIESGIMLIIAESHLYLNNIELALRWSKNAISIAEGNDQLRPLSNALCFHSQILEHKEDFEEALIFSKKCNKYRDSLFLIEKSNQTNSLMVRIDQEKSNRKLTEIREHSMRSAQQLRSRNILASVLFVSLLVFGILSWFLRKNILNRISATVELNEKQDELHKESINRIKLENKHQLTLALLDGQENERKRMSRDLHDGIGGVLSSVRLNLDHLASTKVLENDDVMKSAIEGVKTSIEEIRSISRNAMPEALLKDGLIISLQNYIYSLSNSTKINIELQVYEEIVFSSEVSIMLFRILQELIHNAIKHSDASRIEVLFVREECFYKITVSDDGVGFDYNGISEKSGLANVAQRVAYLNGTVEFDTNSAGACYVFIEIPIGLE